jgi:hypothetical protein
MRGLTAIGLVVVLGASTAHAATPAEVLCSSYKNAVAKETDHAKREAMIKSLPHGCEVKAAPARKPEPVKEPVKTKPEAAPAAPTPAPAPIPVVAPEPAPPPMPPPEAPLPAGVSAEQANENGKWDDRA